MSLIPYIPQDRIRAIANGLSLPDRTSGSALFADISGFTPLTEKLRSVFGARRGAEVLTQQLNLVYTGLIAEVEVFGGSVIGFAGDSITCWFDDSRGQAALRAVAAAFAMQTAIKSLNNVPLSSNITSPLTLKISVASGPARRFAVGDPEIGLLDTLAGATITRTSFAEHLARPGEILVDENTALAQDAALSLQKWRSDPETRERFALVATSSSDIKPIVSETIPGLPAEALRDWVQRGIAERLEVDEGGFLSEFRPTTALFVRFGGIDYDSDQAENQLDHFIRLVQSRVNETEGTLFQLTIGDKGSYFHANFGAISAHEDDPLRAVRTARGLMKVGAELEYLAPLQIGITHGVIYVGPYGGPTRRTYGVQGDDINLAARLMQSALPGEILVSSRIQQAVSEDFALKPRAPLSMKGKAEPLSVFGVIGARQHRSIRLQEPHYSLPLVGRRIELETILEKLRLASQGQAQVVGIVGEAGIGKSRLVAESVRLARGMGFIGYGGACRSDGIYSPYLAWKTIWSAFFSIDPDMAARKQIRWLEAELGDRAPHRVNALPLLGPLLDIPIPENEFTQTLEPKFRQSALHSLLEDCLRTAVGEDPLLIVIEDLHWIDPLSLQLINFLVKALIDDPICFLLAHRPPESLPKKSPALDALPNFSKISLRELNQFEAEQAIRAKLIQLYPARGGSVPRDLVDKLMSRSQGNPFYLEELLNYLRDRGLDPRDPADLGKIELPDSLHSLILSRIDHLTQSEKNTLRVASIVGRHFRAKWLTGYYPELGELSHVKAILKVLDSLEITPLDTTEAELAYLFKHIVTHEVTYHNLPFATRSRLHEKLAAFLEKTYPDSLPVETLAFHYGHSENLEKQIEFLRKAGEAAQKSFANETALAYFGNLLPLLKVGAEWFEVIIKRGNVLELTGDFDAAETDYRTALEKAGLNMSAKAVAQFALGKLFRLRGEYAASLEWLERSMETSIAQNDKKILAQVLIEMGAVYARMGDYDQATAPLKEGVALVQDMNDGEGMALAFNNLGNVFYRKGDYAEAQDFHEKSLMLRRKTGDKWGISASLNNLGIVALMQSEMSAARKYFEESLDLRREMGDKPGLSASLNNLGNLVKDLGDYEAAKVMYTESLDLARGMGDKRGIAMAYLNLGVLSLAQGDHLSAQERYEKSLALLRETEDKQGIALLLTNLGEVARIVDDYPKAQKMNEESLELNREMGDQSGITISLLNLAGIFLAQGEQAKAQSLFEESLTLSQETNQKSLIGYSKLGLGLCALDSAANEACHYFQQSLLLFRQSGQKLQQSSCLVGMAGVSLREGRPEESAKLLGTVDSALRLLKASLELDIVPHYREIRETSKELLGEAAFREAWELGKKKGLAEAVALALEATE